MCGNVSIRFLRTLPLTLKSTALEELLLFSLLLSTDGKIELTAAVSASFSESESLIGLILLLITGIFSGLFSLPVKHHL